MRVLVISDVHGNLPALERVLEERNDGVIFLGDVAGYGPDVSECIDLLRDSLLFGVRGNHDHAIISQSSPGCREEMERLAEITHELNLSTMGGSDFRFLSSLPVARGLKIEGISIYAVHATMRNPLYEYLYPEESDESFEDAFPDLFADFVFCGHTHVQFSKDLSLCKLVNPGSVGQPRDGDWRTSFCILDTSERTFEFGRAEYPVERFERRIREEGYPEELIEVLRRGLP